MPGPAIADAATWAAIASPPADGDDVKVSGGTAPFRANVLQPYANRDAYLYSGPYHTHRTHLRAEVQDILGDRLWVLRACARIALERAASAGTIDALSTSVDTALALPVLTASTWYYVYAYNNAGSLALEYSTTVPTADLRSKTGDSTRAYLGCFVTDSAGKAIPMMQVGRRYTFRGGHTAITGTPLRLGDTAGQPAGPYTVSAKVPPHVEVCTVMYKSSAASASAPRTAGVATTGDSAVHLHSWKSGANGEFQTGTAELVVVGGTIDLYASHATEVTCFADLTGFEE